MLAAISAGLLAEIGPAGRMYQEDRPCGRPLGNGGVDWSRVGAWARVHPTSGRRSSMIAPSFCVAMLPLEAPDGCFELFPAWASDVGHLRPRQARSVSLTEGHPQGMMADAEGRTWTTCAMWPRDAPSVRWVRSASRPAERDAVVEVGVVKQLVFARSDQAGGWCPGVARPNGPAAQGSRICRVDALFAQICSFGRKAQHSI